MGNLYTLHIKTSNKTNIEINGDHLVLNKKSIDLDTKEALIKCYKEIAKDILPDRVHIYATKMNYEYNQIRIKSSKTRWGSCSSKKNINLNWALLMSPLNVLDYVVIHELCHLKEMNHSKKFWDLVKSYDPNYKKHIKWLKDHQHWLKI
jgi:Predicted metal-dependent hydrolase